MSTATTHIETDKQLVPALRFKEYEEDWNRKKIREILTIGSGKDYKHLAPGNIPVYGTGGLMAKVNTAIHSGKTVFIGRKGSINKPFYYDGDFWTVDTLFYTHSFQESEPYFIYGLFQKINWYKHNEASGVPSLSKTTIGSLVVNLPSLPEQQKIASFLSAIDEKIQQLTKKKTLLEQYKKGVMQQLFSGQLRFKDENGNPYPDWEEKRLGKVFGVIRGKGISKDQLNYNGETKCILYGQLYTTYSEVVFNVVSRTDTNEGVLSMKGDLLVPSSTTTTGIDLANVTALNEEGVLLGGDISILRSKLDTNNVFYAYYLSNHKKYEIAAFAQGSTIVHLSYNHFKVMRIDVPVIKEQQKIATYLSSIDTKIESLKNQITQTQTFKKGLLQQMFI